jgi:hypothetical protein
MLSTHTAPNILASSIAVEPLRSHSHHNSHDHDTFETVHHFPNLHQAFSLFHIPTHIHIVHSHPSFSFIAHCNCYRICFHHYSEHLQSHGPILYITTSTFSSGASSTYTYQLYTSSGTPNLLVHCPPSSRRNLPSFLDQNEESTRYGSSASETNLESCHSRMDVRCNSQSATFHLRWRPQLPISHASTFWSSGIASLQLLP